MFKYGSEDGRSDGSRYMTFTFLLFPFIDFSSLLCLFFHFFFYLPLFVFILWQRNENHRSKSCHFFICNSIIRMDSSIIWKNGENNIGSINWESFFCFLTILLIFFLVLLPNNLTLWRECWSSLEHTCYIKRLLFLSSQEFWQLIVIFHYSLYSL